MPLNKALLSNGLRDLFEGNDPSMPGEKVFPPNETEAGKKWAAVYKKYAEGALAGTTQPLAVSLTAAQNTLAGALAGAFTTAKLNPTPAAVAVLAAAMDVAFVAFWLVPPVAFAAPPPPAPPTMAGVVSVAPPGVLTGLLSAMFAAGAVQEKSAADQADALAMILDAWTRSVMVINTPITPPGPPLPPIPLT